MDNFLGNNQLMNVGIYTMCSDNYVEMTSNMIFSFLENNKWFKHDGNKIIVLCDEGKCLKLSKENREYLQSLSSQVIIKQIDSNIYNGISDNQRRIALHRKEYSCCFYKYEMFREDDDFDIKIWLDGDMLIIGDLSSQITDKMYDAGLVMCNDAIIKGQFLNGNFSKYGRTNYVNGGFIFVTNDFLKKNHVFDILFNFSKDMDKCQFRSNDLYFCNGQFPEQDIMNSCFDFYNKLYCADSIVFNCRLDCVCEKTIIIHYYAAPFKPNNSFYADNCSNLAYDLYYKYDYIRRNRGGNILCELNGRLGNVMFQIANAERLANLYHKKVLYHRIDDSENKYWFGDDIKFIRERFHTASDEEYRAFSVDNSRNLISERDSDYTDLSSIGLYSNTQLAGLYQRERYIDRSLYNKLFAPSESLIERLADKYGDVSDYVGICVRRGDYLSKENIKKFYTPTKEWYLGAYKRFFSGRKCIISSDDIEWAKKNIKIDNAIYAEGLSLEENFYLLASCRDHIIANTTLCWHVCYLFEKENSTNIVPDKFFFDEKYNYGSNIYPDRWIRFALENNYEKLEDNMSEDSKLKIDVYALCKNEIKLAPFFIDYWKALGDDVNVYIYDGSSTDGTRELFSKYDWIHIIDFEPNAINEFDHTNLKNTCWKESRKRGTDFVMVCDFDETIFSYSVEELRSELLFMKHNNYSILAPLSFNIVCDEFPSYAEGKFLHELCETGFNDYIWESKSILFNPNMIDEFNTGNGGHDAYPTGDVRWYQSKKMFLIHAKFVGYDFYSGRIKHRIISEEGKKAKFLGETDKTDEELMNNFNNCKSKAFKFSDIKDHFNEYYAIKSWVDFSKYKYKNLIDQPLVNVIIPCKNCADTIQYTISSIKKQSYTNFECLLIDDLSDDNTIDIIKNEINGDDRFRILVNGTGKHGPGVCRNIGLKESCGKYTVFVDSDDMIANDYLNNATFMMENNESTGIVFGKRMFFGKEGCFIDESLKFPFNYNELLEQNRLPIFCMFKTEDGKQIGGFDEDCLYFEDWDFWLRLVPGKNIIKLNNICYLYRRGYGESKLDRDMKAFSEGVNYIRKKYTK